MHAGSWPLPREVSHSGGGWHRGSSEQLDTRKGQRHSEKRVRTMEKEAEWCKMGFKGLRALTYRITVLVATVSTLKSVKVLSGQTILILPFSVLHLTETVM